MVNWLVGVRYRIPGTMRFKDDVLAVQTTEQTHRADVPGHFRAQHPGHADWFITEVVLDA